MPDNTLYANISQVPGVLSAPRLAAQPGPPLGPNQAPDLALAGIHVPLWLVAAGVGWWLWANRRRITR
jgi:hypothetical protein